MLGEFTFYNYNDAGSAFTHSLDAGVMRIENEAAIGRATWFASWQGEIAEGQTYRVKAKVEAQPTANVRVVYWNAQGAYLSSSDLGSFTDNTQFVEVNSVIAVPAGAAKMRLDLRYWNSQGEAKFKEVSMEALPDIDKLPAVPVLLPIDNPNGLASFQVRWEASARATSYELEQQPPEGDPVIAYAGDGIAYDIAGAAPGQHVFKVRAVNAVGGSAWSAEQATAVVGGEPLPAVPVLLPIDNPDGLDEFRVLWEASEGAVSYELEHTLIGGAAVIYEVDALFKVITDAEVAQYSFRVRAVNGAGVSAWSAAQETTVLELVDDSSAEYYPQPYDPYPLDENSGHWLSPMTWGLELNGSDEAAPVFTLSGQLQAAQFQLLPSDQAIIRLPVPSDKRYAVQGMIRMTAGAAHAAIWAGSYLVADIDGVKRGLKWYSFTAYAEQAGSPATIDIQNLSEEENALLEIAGVMVYEAL